MAGSGQAGGGSGANTNSKVPKFLRQNLERSSCARTWAGAGQRAGGQRAGLLVTWSPAAGGQAGGLGLGRGGHQAGSGHAAGSGQAAGGGRWVGAVGRQCAGGRRAVGSGACGGPQPRRRRCQAVGSGPVAAGRGPQWQVGSAAAAQRSWQWESQWDCGRGGTGLAAGGLGPGRLGLGPGPWGGPVGGSLHWQVGR